MAIDAVCTGCGRTAISTGEYDPKENPVESDGTYEDHKFVCTGCYCQLIPLGLDVGTPAVIQARAKKYIGKAVT